MKVSEILQKARDLISEPWRHKRILAYCSIVAIRNFMLPIVGCAGVLNRQQKTQYTNGK